MLKGTHAALPPSSAVSFRWRSLGRYCAISLEGSRMISKAPSHESDQRPDDKPKKLQVLTYKPKATFRWPPDCLWPFMDDGLDRDT